MPNAWSYNAQPPRPAWGVRAPTLKGLATAHPIRVAPPPARAVLVLGHVPALRVAPGERVLAGQLLATTPDGRGVHAPTSGVVAAIGDQPVPGPVPTSGPCLVLEADGRDQWNPACRPVLDPLALAPAEIRDRVRAAGVLGLGGALFPTATKLAVPGPIRALLVNGVECEPWIASDEMLLRERADRVLDGARIMMRALGTDRAVVAVEADMPEARIALRDALAAAGDDGAIGLAVVTAKYPAGGERQLVELVAGVEVPTGRRPHDIGYVCQNVGTAAAVSELFRTGRPLVSRIVTVTGGGVAAPGTFEARLGTPVADLVALAGGYAAEPARLLVGGPMMGYALPDDGMPVTAATNCIVAALEDELAPPRPEMPCIRCGDCVDACPAGLMPNELFAALRRGDAADLRTLGLADCIECGCCDYVCPSMIPLAPRFAAAKAAGAAGSEVAGARGGPP